MMRSGWQKAHGIFVLVSIAMAKGWNMQVRSPFKTYLAVCRDPISSLSHAVGFLASLVASASLMVNLQGLDLSRQFAVLLYGVTMVALFASSAIYHYIPSSPERIAFWRRLDHSAVFAFVASSWTLIAMSTLQGRVAIVFLGFVWSIALYGVYCRVRGTLQSRAMRVVTYNLMGWSGALLLPQLVLQLGAGGCFWLVTGGGLFGLGALVYLFKWPNFSARWDFHAIWHCFVLAGVACHYVLVTVYILAR